MKFVNQGTDWDGTHYVDVVNDSGDPIEYLVTEADAIATYGRCEEVNNPGDLA